MAKVKDGYKKVIKHIRHVTSIGRNASVKNKSKKRSYKPSRGQG